METLSFFGENGLTSTSANHIANLAKEYLRNLREKVSSIRFFNETIGLITSKEEHLVSAGAKNIKNVPEILELIGRTNSLIAFLREGIKEKERLSKEAREWTDADRDKEFLTRSLSIVRPVKKTYPTEEDIKKEWSIGQQEKYLSLEAEAAAIGKAIHEDGPLSNARILYMHRCENPVSIQDSGVNTIIHKYEPTVSLKEVEDLFVGLQKRYRTIQAELNGIKKSIEDTIVERRIAIDNEFNAAMREYDAINLEWERDKRKYEEERDMHRLELTKQVQALKIVVPNNLRDVYEAVQNI